MFFSKRNLLLTTTAVAALTAAVPVFADGTVMFNYQGRVKVQGVEHNGDGQFKFAIISPNGSSTLWSNDGTSVDGSEPTTGLTLTVTDGVFNVVMGANGLMLPINSTVFQTKEPLKLRTWFNDGVNGFQQLHPDHNLINTNLITSQTGGDDFTIYVDGQNGDDSNSGLKPNQAKKTVQGAVDILPGRVMASVTIDIANGTYPEKVTVYGISVKPGETLSFQGDEAWTPSSPGAPAVIISAAATGSAAAQENVVLAADCTGVEFHGIAFEGATATGVKFENGKFNLEKCLIRNNGGVGLEIINQAHSTLDNVVASNNGNSGIEVRSQSRSFMTSPISKSNGRYGLLLMDSSTVNIFTSANFSSNNEHGIHCIGSSQIGVDNTFQGTVQNNKGYGLSAGWYSYFHNFENRLNISGNILGPTFEFKGGEVYW